jgi:hypothetical protein
MILQLYIFHTFRVTTTEVYKPPGGNNGFKEIKVIAMDIGHGAYMVGEEGTDTMFLQDWHYLDWKKR